MQRLSCVVVFCLMLQSAVSTSASADRAYENPGPLSSRPALSTQALSVLAVAFKQHAFDWQNAITWVGLDHALAQGHYAERRTHPLRSATYTHVGPALPVYQSLYEHKSTGQNSTSIALNLELIKQRLLKENRLVYGSNFDLAPVSKFVEHQIPGIRIDWSGVTDHSPHATICVYFDKESNTLIFQDGLSTLSSYKLERKHFLTLRQKGRNFRTVTVTGKRVSAGNITGHPASDDVLDYLYQVFAGYANVLNIPLATYLDEQIPWQIDVHFQKGLDHMETVYVPSPLGRQFDKFDLYIPLEQFADSSSSSLAQRQFRAAMYSEVGHMLYPHFSDRKLEPEALYAFASNEGLKQVRATLVPFVTSSEYAARVVRYIDQIFAEPGFRKRGSYRKQADWLLAVPEWQEGELRYIDLIFDRLFTKEFMPNRRIWRLGGSWYIRKTHPLKAPAVVRRSA